MFYSQEATVILVQQIGFSYLIEFPICEGFDLPIPLDAPVGFSWEFDKPTASMVLYAGYNSSEIVTLLEFPLLDSALPSEAWNDYLTPEGSLDFRSLSQGTSRNRDAPFVVRLPFDEDIGCFTLIPVVRTAVFPTRVVPDDDL